MLLSAGRVRVITGRRNVLGKIPFSLEESCQMTKRGRLQVK